MDMRIYFTCLTGLISLCFLQIYQVSALDKNSVFVFGGENARQKRSKNGGGDTGQQPDITEFLISSKVQSRFATVVVSSRMVNKGDQSKEASFVVQIPETAFISKFSMVINGTTYLGKVYEKKEAQKKYDEAKDKGESAGQVSHQGITLSRGMDIFTISANVAANSAVSFEVTYQELLERRRSKYIQRFNVQPLQIVPDLTLTADVTESQGFKEFSFQLPNSTVEVTTSQGSAKLVDTPTTRSVVYKPTVEEQRGFNARTGIDGEFVVMYDVNQRRDGGVMVIKDDCFNHYVAPKNLQALDKNIVFLIDISGSMSGDKIRQARESLLIVIDQLKPEDVFNILVFSNSVDRWRSEPHKASSTNIANAKAYVKENVIADGGTNINTALLEAVGSLKNSFKLPGIRASLIVFLTDGDPTAGVTNTKRIRENVQEVNSGEKRIAIFTLAFGFDLKIEFLKELSWENGGFFRRIYAEQDAISQLTDFYLEIQNPVLVNVNIQYDLQFVDPNDVTQVEYLQYFEGSELVIAGRTKIPVTRPDKMSASVVGMGKEGQVDLQVVSKKLLLPEETGATCQLYAYLKIKDLLRQQAIAGTQEEADSLERKALAMSLKYGFVTPLTSLVVVQGHQRKQSANKKMGDKILYSDSTAFITPSLVLYYLALMISISVLNGMN